MWFFSNYGRLGIFGKNFKNNVKIKNTNVSTIYEEATKISKHEHEYSNSPYTSSLAHLGTKGANDFFFEGTLPRIIIFGDTYEDWALFWSMRALYGHVHWVPPSLLNLGGTYYDKFDHLLLDLISIYSFNNASYPPLITSQSLDEATIRTEVGNALTRISNAYSPHAPYRFDIQLNFSKLFNNWLLFGEMNNKNEQSILFNEEGESIQRIPSLAPKSFSPNPTEVSFYVDLISDRFKYIGHPLSKASPAVWRNTRSKLDADSKKTITGDLTFWGVSHLVMSGQDLNSLLQGPRIKVLSVIDQFFEISKEKNLFAQKTVETQNVETALRMWNNSLEQFIADMFIKDTLEIFKIYKNNYNKGHLQITPRLGNNKGLFFQEGSFLL